MSAFKHSILKFSNKAHLWLGWTGGIALLLFALSGITHPLMLWTGPKALSFFPPQAVIQADLAEKIPATLKNAGISKAIAVKIVPSELGNLLQVTEQGDKPRRYFDLSNNQELKNYDQQHAIWLARYYTGLENTPVKSIEFQQQFSDEYPWVNRLLPVYKITFDTEDNLNTFIYTELGALAGLSNNWKTRLQTIFKFVHTWSWLDNFEYARVFLILVLALSLFMMALTGIAMIFLISRRQSNTLTKKRKVHRFVAYIIWLPVLMFSSSGTYHLLQSTYTNNFTDNKSGLQLPPAFSITPDRLSSDIQWLEQYQQTKLNGMSIVEGNQGQLMYRLSIPQGRHGQNIEKQKRFDGVIIEKSALYFSALTGLETKTDDQEMARYFAKKQSGLDESLVNNTQLISRFGPEYDFRNKRLPVWRIDYNTHESDKLFIDPASGFLVDSMSNSQRIESYSFSYLHKWNFLVPLVGRVWRDTIMVIILSGAVLSTILGFTMLIRRQKRNKKRSS